MELSLNTLKSYLDVIRCVYGDTTLKGVVNGVILEPRAARRVTHVEMQWIGTWRVRKKAYSMTVAFRFSRVRVQN